MTEDDKLDALFHKLVDRLEKIFGREHVPLAKRQRLARNLLQSLTPDEISAIRSRIGRGLSGQEG
jgi:hypothetical protein